MLAYVFVRSQKIKAKRKNKANKKQTIYRISQDLKTLC